jgi:hypothetical protein
VAGAPGTLTGTWTEAAAGSTFSSVVVQSYTTSIFPGTYFTTAGGFMDAFGVDVNGDLRTLWNWQNPS